MKPRALATLLNTRECRVLVEFYQGAVYFHFKVKRRALTALRQLRNAVPKMERLMATLGFEVAHLFIPDGDEKLYRFCEHFGFEYDERRNNWIVMKREINHA